MKITILDAAPEEEEEVIIKCHEISEDINALLLKIKQGNTKLAGYDQDGIHLFVPDEIYYFDTVDQKVFAYCATNVYEVKEKLYELETILPVTSFIRSSKSNILNLDKIKSISPAFGGRFEAVLINEEKTIISRQYVPVLKERLGL